MLALSSFHCEASHPTVGVRLPGADGVEVAQMFESVEVLGINAANVKVHNGG